MKCRIFAHNFNIHINFDSHLPFHFDITHKDLTMSSTTLPILISGAGIAGLALAQGLLKAGIPFLIFERDAKLNVRSQGYRVRLNPDGIAALQEVLPPLLFNRLEGSCAIITSKGMAPKNRLDAFSGKDLKTTFRMPLAQNDVEHLNADREVLRSVLMAGLAQFVVFGKELVSYKCEDDGVIARFSDGSEVKGSLLVGADGARSRIRKQLLPGRNLLDTEGRFIYGKTALTPQFESMFNARALEGLTNVQDRSNENEVPLSLLLEPIRFKDNEFRSELPADYVYWVVMTRKDQLRLTDDNLSNLNPSEATELARDLTQHWDPSFHPLFELQQGDKSSIIKMYSVAPEIPSWDDAGMVTLIGDSAHAMSPTAAVGAVCALRDAALLARLLADEGVNTRSLRKYEAAMREWAGQAVGRSQIGGFHLFAMKPFGELKQVEA